MPYDVMDISRYIINHSIDIKRPISNLKLQKLLYYIQAAFIIERGNRCFDGELSRWRHGPVEENVYRAFRKYKDMEILEKQNYYNDMIIKDGKFKWDTIEFNDNIIVNEDKDLINKIVDSYKDYGAWDMVEKTHKEDPWKNTKANEIINISQIEEYFKDKEQSIYGSNK